MITTSTAVSLDDIPSLGTELAEDELAAVSGGMRIIIILHACSSAMGGGYDYD